MAPPTCPLPTAGPPPTTMNPSVGSDQSRIMNTQVVQRAAPEPRQSVFQQSKANARRANQGALLPGQQGGAGRQCGVGAARLSSHACQASLSSLQHLATPPPRLGLLCSPGLGGRGRGRAGGGSRLHAGFVGVAVPPRWPAARPPTYRARMPLPAPTPTTFVGRTFVGWF